MESSKKIIEFEDILTEIGEYGRYQKRLLYLFLLPLILFGSVQNLNLMFILSSPEFKCFNNDTANMNADISNISTISNITNIGKSYKDQCYINDTKCSSFVFDKSNYDDTAVTHYNLVCDRDHIKALILSLSSAGDVLGDLILGYLSDKIGRHKIFFLSLSVALLSSISPIIFRGLIVFIVFRFFNGIANAALFNLPYIALTEVVGPKQRTHVMWVTATCWTVAMCIIPFIAWISRDWITLFVVPTILISPFFAYWTFFPESPRWLISQGRYDEAFEILKKMAKVNKKTVPSDLMDKIKSVKSDNDQNISNISEMQNLNDIGDGNEDIGHRAKHIDAANKNIKTSRAPILDILLLSGLRKKFLILSFAWISCCAVYGGLTLNFENFHGNEFINWFLLSVVEFPSNFVVCIMMETRLGRRWTHSLTMTIGGVVLLFPIFLSPRYIIIASMIGKFLTNIAFNTVYQQTAELFPTPIRNSGLAFVSAIATAANFALPYLTALGKIAIWIPLSVIGISAVISGLIASFLPETLNENLPQTIKDGNNFGKKSKYFSLANVHKDDMKDKNLEIDKL